MRCLPALFALLFGLQLSPELPAQNAGSTALASERENLEQKQQNQEALRQRVREIVRQLDAIILEFERNGLSGPDLAELRRTRQLLAENSVEAMAEVIKRIERAQYARSNSVAITLLVRAFEGQQGILDDLRGLLADYNQKRDVSQVPIILLELAARQQANLDSAINLARTLRPDRDLTEFQSASVDAQYEEQRDIGQQFNFIVSTMEILANSNDPEVAPLYRAALLRMQQGQTVGVLARALQALDQEQVFSAVSLEKQAHEQLVALARFLTPRRPASEILRDLAQRVRRLIEQQEEIKGRAETHLQNNRHVRDLSAFQGELVVEASDIRNEARILAPPVIDPLEQAIAQMQAARVALEDNDPVQRQRMPQHATQAIQKLQEVLRLLEEAAERAAAQEQLAADLPEPEAAEEFARKLQQLIALQAELNRQTEAQEQSGASLSAAVPEQERIRGLTTFLQAEARTVAPDTVTILGLAAQKMQQALQALPVDARARLAIQLQREALALLQQAAEQAAAEQAAQEELLAQDDPDAEQLDAEALDEAEEALDEAQEAAEDAEENLAEGEVEEALDDIEDALDALDEAEEAGQQPDQEGEPTDQNQEDPQDPAEESQDSQDPADESEADQEGEADEPPTDPQAEEAAEEQEGEATEEAEQPSDEPEALPTDEEPTQPLDLAQDEAEEGEEALPEEAQQAIDEAREALEEAREHAEAGEEEAAQEDLEEAIDAIERAQEAIDEAQEGELAEELLAEIEAELTDPQAGEEGEEGEEESPGEPTEEEQLAQDATEGEGTEEGEEELPTELAENADDPEDTEDFTSTGERTGTDPLDGLGDGAYTALPARDRAAIEQSLSEEYPEDYEAFIQQYRRNLAEATR